MLDLATMFAPAERASPAEVERQHEKLAALPYVRTFLDAAPTMSVVLNAHRQIVFANRAFAAFLGRNSVEELLGIGPNTPGSRKPGVLGRRPGEAVGCIRAGLTEGGCGTTVFCRNCGAMNAILNSQRTHALDVQECRMITGEEGMNETALDLRIWSHPIDVQGEPYTVFSVVDASNEKRREALERIFFHDVLNTAGVVKGLADLLVQGRIPATGIKEAAEMLAESAGQLVEEISVQRMLSAAETDELSVSAQLEHSRELLTGVLHQFHGNGLARDKALVIDASAQQLEIVTDAVLLRRVLVNLVKNALEAVGAGSTVTLGAHAEGEMVCFTVHNAAVMPQAVQLQVFSRSFSTKGSGRGLGTYSIKLISERYLRGRVSFVSNEQEGTRFTVRYPKAI